MPPTARAHLVSLSRVESENPKGNSVSLKGVLGEIEKLQAPVFMS